jgi:type IV pilus biogenesis protein CpaD/CtpE
MLSTGITLAMAGCASEPSHPPPVQYIGADCPQWWQFPADHHSNADSPYLGCVTAINFRAMVADQADLERGRPLGRGDAERESRAIEAYQQGKVKPFQGSGSMSPQTSGGSGPQ